ncbi:MAG TPA: MoaD family protein [Candidatus Limnocylindrales bacterium]|nr:MoaD family protein [Candidatus Limnocylindrales bacterium]
MRLFAMQREIAGTRSLELDLHDGATVEDAWSALIERFPRLAPGRAAVRFARNGAYTDAETGLADGDEVAMIPPVSGGAGDSAADGSASGDRIRILQIRVDPFPSEILSELGARVATPEDGAVVGFLGVTRRSPGTPAPGQEAEAARHAGRAVEALTYETLEPMALAVMAEIADEIEARFGVTRLAIVHREGEVPLGEVSVAIVAASPHRDAAFDAARYAIDETKGRAPIWKAETFSDGHVWIGEPARQGPPRGDPRG